MLISIKTVFQNYVQNTVSKIPAKVVDFGKVGGVPDDMSERAAWSNGRLMNETFLTLLPGNHLN